MFMHTIDLGKYDYRTDLIDEKTSNSTSVKENLNNGISIDRREVFNNGCKNNYITINFLDITDKNNYLEVENVFVCELKKIIGDVLSKKILVVGLGNSKSTPDALGPLVIDNVLVTSHLFKLGEVEKGYSNVCSFKPNVTGVTGIETSNLVNNLVKFLNVDLVIVIDALAARSISRINKTIQITDSGITPGSGVGNYRDEISKKKLGVPVIAIGVPTIVDAATIVSDTFFYMIKQFSYKVNNFNNAKLKLINEDKQDYSQETCFLSDTLKEKLLGIIGTLSEEELNKLFQEVLIPIDCNMLVTPKEVDFIIEKLSMLIGNGINKTLHEAFNPTN